MARYVQDVVLNKPDNFVFYIMNDFLQKNGFVLADWKGEQAYRAGDPMLTGYRYLKYSYTNGVFHLEAWMMGTFGGEWDLEGFVGIAQKGPYKNNLQLLIQTLQQPLPQQQPIPQQQMDVPSGTSPQPSDIQPANTQPDGTQSADTPVTNTPTTDDLYTGNPAPTAIPVQTVDNQTAATLGLIFGILSIVFCCIPILGLVFGILGLSQARMGACSSKAGMAKAGKICSIVGLSFTGCMFILNIASSVLTVILDILEM